MNKDELYAMMQKALLDVEWLVNLMTPEAQKAYDEAVALARKAYNEAVAPAQKAYDEAESPARKAYNEAVAPARKAYYEAESLALLKGLRCSL